MHHGIAQQVFQRRQHAFQQLAVEFGAGALDHEFGVFAGVGRGLTHDARQPLHMPLERHHAGAQQAVLQFADHAALLLQQVLCVGALGL